MFNNLNATYLKAEGRIVKIPLRLVSDWTSIHALLFSAILLLSHAAITSAQSDIVLGAGDTIRITVFGHPDLTTVARVSEQGVVNFPFLGEISLKGLSERESEAKIAAELDRQRYIQSPQVTVIFEEFKSQQVRVLGEVHNPGKYPVNSGSAVIDLIALAGGITPDGSEYIVVTRQLDGKTVRETIDFGQALQSNNTASEIVLGENDTIYVPRKEVFYTYGQVHNPGAYRLEKHMTVMQAISVSGGLTDIATERGLEIRRTSETGEPVTFKAKLTDLLQPNDTVFVKESVF